MMREVHYFEDNTKGKNRVISETGNDVYFCFLCFYSISVMFLITVDFVCLKKMVSRINGMVLNKEKIRKRLRGALDIVLYVPSDSAALSSGAEEFFGR